ncbi:sensor histidine kinase [Vibrio maerlii]|uniref:sensor histidine kinase n=1 Tax=Vibrio maerlii TaxID=2231648 RepID=UPI000E3D9BF9|nr:HAMP domain-containing sensor histidine kinase [Vibrio maerlii]
MRFQLRHQLTATYLLVSLITAGVTYAWVVLTSEHRLNELTLEYQTREMQQEVIAWYKAEQSWEGFEAYFKELHPPHFKKPNSTTVNKHPLYSDPKEDPRPKRHGIVTAENIALISYLRFKKGEFIPPAYFDQSEPIYLDGKLIARIIPPEATGLSINSRNRVFLDNIHNILMFAIFVGVITSLLLGVILSRWLLKPLEQIHQAISSMAKGRLKQKVKVKASNELGELASGFNSMSSNIAKADQKKRQLTADITHDLNTPIQVISGYIEMAQHGAIELDEKRLSLIASELGLIERLVKDMNLLAKTDTKTLKLDITQVSISELMTSVHHRFEPRCHAKVISLDLDLVEPLPTLDLDRNRMLQVLGNLVDNAIRHTPKQGLISLTATANEAYCEIKVTDTGCGIEADQLPYIFDRFYRAESSRSGDEGNSGLGLSITKGLLEMQGGEISVSSDGLSGSEFTVRLPVGN